MARSTSKKRGKSSRPDFDAIADGLHPSLVEGLTVGVPVEEIARKRPSTGPDLGHMASDPVLVGTRQPNPHFVVMDSDDAVWMDGVHMDRLMRNIQKTYTPQGVRLLKEGRQCLRCDEPQPDAFPVLCDLCGYPMKDRQIMDIAMEFEGDVHLGPAKPISQYLAEQDERVEKRKFERKIKAGRSPMKGIKHGKRTTGNG